MTKKELTKKEFLQLLDPIGFGVFQEFEAVEGKEKKVPVVHTYNKKTTDETGKEVVEEKKYYKTQIVNKIEVEGQPVNVTIDVLTNLTLDWQKVQGSFMDLENNPILNHLPEKVFIKTSYKDKAGQFVPLKTPAIKTSIWLENEAIKDLQFEAKQQKATFKKSM